MTSNISGGKNQKATSHHSIADIPLRDEGANPHRELRRGFLGRAARARSGPSRCRRALLFHVALSNRSNAALTHRAISAREVLGLATDDAV